MNWLQLIEALQEKVTSLRNALTALNTLCANEKRTMTEVEDAEYEKNKGGIVAAEKQIARYREQIAADAATATPIVAVVGVQHNPAVAAAAAVASPAVQVVSTRGPTLLGVSRSHKSGNEKFQGQSATRLFIAAICGQLTNTPAAAIAFARWGKEAPDLAYILQNRHAMPNIFAADVAGGGTGSGDWGAELLQRDANYSGDFIDFLYAQTVYDKLALRTVPANVTIKGQDGQATGYWVGEGKGIPVSKADYMDVTLTSLKVGALAVISKELLFNSSPAAEQLVRDALVNSSGQRVDQTFLSATAASAGVSPAGVFNGVSAGSSAGTGADDVRQDLFDLLQVFIAAKNASGLNVVTTPSLASAISFQRTSLGIKEFPDARYDGGTLETIPMVTGDNVPAGTFALLKPSDIYKIENRGLEVSVSQDATIEMSDAPAGNIDVPAAQANKPVNMFQTDSVAIKVVRPISFAKRRSHAAQYINDAAYVVSNGQTST